LAKNIWLIATFAILHGLNEWADMLIIAQKQSASAVLHIVRNVLLPLSFLPLLQFGTNGIIDFKKLSRRLRFAPVFFSALWVILIVRSKEPSLMADVWARYLLAVPGIFLTTFAFHLLYNDTREMPAGATPGRHLKTAILGLFLYGCFAGLTVPDADFFPARLLNYSNFYNVTGIPIQVFRTICAVIIAYSLIKVLAIFDLETKAALIKSRDELEMKVKERTRDLVELNASLDREIVDHKRAEVLLKHERDRMQEYLNVAGVIMLVIDADEKVILINKKGCEILGYREKEIVGKNWFDLCVPQEKREEMRTVFKKMTAGMIEDAEFYENYVVTRNAEQRIMAWHNALLKDEGNKITGILSSGEDITERKNAEAARRESEEKYRDLFENANDAIFIVDADLNYVDVNNKAVELFGFSRNELLTMNILDAVPPEQRSRSFQELSKLKKKESYDKFIGKMKTKEGRWLDVEVSSSPIVKDGSVVGSRDIVRDITERRKLEEELAKREKLDSLGILAGGLAHDFNNLLTGILGNISLAKRYSESSDKLLIRLTEAEKASQRARDLTQQLLTFSKGGAPVKKSADIVDLIKDTVSFSLSGSNVKCVYHIADNLCSANVDTGQISQVINNLVINADQAMPEGGQITIVCENVPLQTGNIFSLAEGNYVKISIKDEGIGICKEYLHKIFDPYFTTKQKGSGLGLASAYSIVSRHNGYIGVDSTLGAGSIFFIYLPASERTITEERLKQDKIVRGKGKILVVDDEELIRNVAGEMLKALGYAVEFAVDGNEAIELYGEARRAKKPFHAVIMDLTMPGGMGGKEAVVKLREMDPDVRTIVSSGYSQDPVVADFRNYGFAGVVSKPYKLSEMSLIVHNVVTGIQT
jgi:PAS domain S-box-containing protein